MRLIGVIAIFALVACASTKGEQIGTATGEAALGGGFVAVGATSLAASAYEGTVIARLPDVGTVKRDTITVAVIAVSVGAAEVIGGCVLLYLGTNGIADAIDGPERRHIDVSPSKPTESIREPKTPKTTHDDFGFQ